MKDLKGEVVGSFHCIDIVNGANHHLKRQKERRGRAEGILRRVTTKVQNMLDELDAGRTTGQ